MVRPSKNDISSTMDKVKDEVLEPNTKGNAKRKCEDENEDVEITLLDGLSKDGSVPAKKHKKVATADKMLKLEQEKV